MTDDDTHTPGSAPPPVITEIDPEAIEPLPREHDTPRPVVIALIALIFLAVAAGFYTIERLGVAGNVLGRPIGAERDKSISSVDEILEEPVKQNLIGRDVMLWRVPVESVVGDYTFWIGPDAERSVPVVLLGERKHRQSETETEMREGDIVVIVGTIRPVRDLQLLEDDQHLRPGETQRLEQSEIYISALTVEQFEK